jgi:ureidoglycolate hydrolase
MDEKMLEIRDYHGEGYKPLVDYGEWRVAILRYLDELQPERIDQMERHTETDEVFVLLCGQGLLILGGTGEEVEDVYPQPMEYGTLYNVKRNAWHTALLSRDASVLLVENNDTGDQNSEYARLSTDHRRLIVEQARQYPFE